MHGAHRQGRASRPRQVLLPPSSRRCELLALGECAEGGGAREEARRVRLLWRENAPLCVRRSEGVGGRSEGGGKDGQRGQAAGAAQGPRRSLLAGARLDLEAPLPSSFPPVCVCGILSHTERGEMLS